jgi:type III secretion system HrpE/YscL family protein
MRVIKAGGAAPRPIVPAAVFDAQREAGRLMAEARCEAERVLATAHAEAEALRTAATVDGREAGLATVTELLVGARTLAAQTRARAAADLRTLAVRIAERILARTIALSPDAVADVASQALALAGEPRQVRVRCNPADLATLKAAGGRLGAVVSGAEVVAFDPDAAVSRGGCVVETELGAVDARLEVQLEAIERALSGASEE